MFPDCVLSSNISFSTDLTNGSRKLRFYSERTSIFLATFAHIFGSSSSRNSSTGQTPSSFSYSSISYFPFLSPALYAISNNTLQRTIRQDQLKIWPFLNCTQFSKYLWETNFSRLSISCNEMRKWTFYEKLVFIYHSTSAKIACQIFAKFFGHSMIPIILIKIQNGRHLRASSALGNFD